MSRRVASSGPSALSVWLGLALLALSAGCGGAGYRAPSDAGFETPPSQEAEQDVAALEQTLESTDEELEQALRPAAAEPLSAEECEQACGLCLSICDLADRICQIAADFPENGVLVDRCLDARVRCKRGTRDTEAVCDCSQVDLRIQI